jgi:hypothetical protein
MPSQVAGPAIAGRSGCQLLGLRARTSLVGLPQSGCAHPPKGRSSRGRAEAFREGRAFDERQRVCIPALPEEVSRATMEREVQRIARAMRRVLRRTGLPHHFTMHSLGHSFCSLLISSGVSPVYVQQQAGHADVGFTVRVYGSWFPATAQGAMDRLADRVPGLPVTNQAVSVTTALGGRSEVLKPTGTTPRRASRGPRTP